MKLFQRLLVAPAALGLFSPLAANATEVNLNDISNYSDVENIELANAFDNEELTKSPLLAGGEGLVDGPDGGFSETTTASFSTDFAIGSVDGLGATTALPDGNQTLQAVYGFQIDLNTSFTGEDSLDISIDGGNAIAGPLSEYDLNGTGDALQVDGVSYTFPVGGLTAIVGDNTDGSALFTTACVYGGPSNTLDDCGNVNAGITNGGAMAGASYDFGNGLTAAVGYAGPETGIMTKESLDYFGGQLAYAGDSYGVSATYASRETSTTAETIYWGFNGYWTPSEVGSLPSVSVGYELGDPSTAGAKDTEQYFVGLQWDEIGPGTLGVAVGSNGAIAEGAQEYAMYEAFYSYPVNDSMTITPAAYLKEGVKDETGLMVKTSFSF